MVSKKQLFDFIDKAGKSTWAGGGKPSENPQRPGFTELEYSEGDFSYIDSYAGGNRSRGMEVVRYKGEPIWSSSYGGGMVEGKEGLADEAFTFLKKAISADEEGFHSFRGPHHFTDGDWKYTYQQDGDEFEFSGYEEIHQGSDLIFFHRIIGGSIEYR